MHDTDGMLKAGVAGTRINKVRETQLVNPSKPLKSRLRNYMLFQLRESDEPIDWIADSV